jgi:hypothetical protein
MRLSVSAARRSSRTRAGVDGHTALPLDAVALVGCEGKVIQF